MELLSIQEVLTLWELNANHVEQAKILIQTNASNALLCLYAIASFKINKGCFFAVFILDEVISYSIIQDSFPEYKYYLLISCVYCCLFWYAESKNMKFKTIIACGIIALFNAGMMFDAIINKEAYSFLYKNYLLIIVSVHLYLISTLLEWERIGRGLGAFFRVFGSSIRTNYNLAFICYTSRN